MPAGSHPVARVRECLQPSFSKTAASLLGRNVAAGIDMAKEEQAQAETKGAADPAPREPSEGR